jgi:tetratricopeptide (TPR) repeat protein
MRQIIVTGSPLPVATGPATDLEAYGLHLETRRAIQVGPLARGQAHEIRLDAADDNLVEIEYSDGGREWMRVDALYRRLSPPSAQRGDATGALLIPERMPVGAGTSRGEPLPIKAIRLLALSGTGQPQRDVAEVIAEIESKLRPGPGLYRIEIDGTIKGPVQQPLPEIGVRPYLLLIHGAFSATGATFASLFSTTEWARLCDQYGDRIYGFNHHTLSHSPVQNALDLLELLPRNAHLHLLTHSRGGLVGELLCLHEIRAVQMAPFRKGRQERSAEIERLGRLSALLADRRLHIDRFVRIACPTRGTVLASGRLDRYLSVILTLAEFALEGSSEFLAFVKAAVLTLIKERAELDQLPGLEALMPEAPLISLLNRYGLRCHADLGVIAGDSQPGGDLANSVKILASDLSFLQPHDLVVNVSAMCAGVEREQKGYLWLDRGAHVTHCSYFANPASRHKIYAWLTRPPGSVVEGFTEINYRDLPEELLRVAPSPPPDSPTVVLIPDLFGSHLRQGERRLWLDPATLADGTLGQLALDASPPAQPDEVVAAGYGPIHNHLTRHFRVIPFPYDWRRSQVKSAKELVKLLRGELERSRSPIHLLAHGAGGLVARALVATAPALWQELKERGGRLLMVGTPQLGSYAVLELLCGQAPLARMLGMVDAQRGVAEVCQLFWTFPGLVELLPQDDAAWRESVAASQLPYRPDARQLQEALKKAGQTWRQLRPPADSTQLCVLAGAGEWTPTGVEPGDQNELLFVGDREGDGIVTCTSARLANVPTWYATAAHGDLLTQPTNFPALVDLLTTGTTNRLPTSLPASAERGERGVRLVRPVLFPTPGEVVRTALGGATAQRMDESPPVVLRLSVVYAGLEHARYPLAVGHYEGDVLSGAASVLNDRLGGRLASRHAMGLYPGPEGTAEVILTPGLSPPGALVIGLGQVGQITARTVTRGIVAAALRLALARTEVTAESGQSQPWQSAAFSALLIGTRGGRALTIESSITAIVTGAILANRVLRDGGLIDKVRITEVQFVELYEDLAIRAAHAVSRIENYLRIARSENEILEVERFLLRGEGGYSGAPSRDHETGWWRRLQVTQPTAGPDGASVAGELDFLLLSERARAERTLLPTQTALVEKLVEQTIHETTNDLAIPATLYELLVPLDLKDQPLESINLMLVLDQATAQYPWEMMAERHLDDGPGDQRRSLRPLSVYIGLLRQLATPDHRVRVQGPRQQTALVVGEPRLNDPSFAPLPGAAAEARAVTQALQEQNYRVTSLIDASATEIINALFAGDYRIVHLCGHGVYRPDSPAQSGMVLGKGIYLTAAEIAQLRIVPEMVFLNCCYVGALDQPAPPPQLRQSQRAWNRLAASIAQELIKVGVRAVVAAGWAVNDAAAQFFATQLYQAMLTAERSLPFGEAVRSARQQLFDHPRFGRTNTWGAYQCYGDPGFTLNVTAETPQRTPEQFVAPDEVMRRLRNIQARASHDEDKKGLSELKEQAAGLEQQVRSQLPADWLNGEMLNELGNTYAELGMFARAIECYREALRASGPKERVPFRTAEQLANLESRFALDLLPKSAAAGEMPEEPVDSKWDGKELLKSAKERLELLLKMAETAERYALLGGHYKRVARASITAKERRDALGKAAESYLAASRIEGERSQHYSTLNWIGCRLLHNPKLDETERQKMRTKIQASLQALNRQRRTELSFWDLVSEPDAQLALALVDHVGVADRFTSETMERIAQSYRNVMSITGTRREHATVTGNLDFLSEMLAHSGENSLAAGLLRIREMIVQKPIAGHLT